MSHIYLLPIAVTWQLTLSYHRDVSHNYLFTLNLSHVRHDTWRCLIIVTYHISCLFSYTCNMSHALFIPHSLWHITYLFTPQSLWRVTYLFTPPSLSHVRHDTWRCLIIVTYHMHCLLSYPCDASHICLLPLSLSHVRRVVYSPIPVTSQVCCFLCPSHISDMLFTSLSLWHVFFTLLTLWCVKHLFTSL